MNRIRITRLVLPAALAAALALPASAGARYDAPPAAHSSISLKGVHLRIGGQTDGLRSLLVRSGALKGKAYKLSWSSFSSGPPLVEAIQAGRIDVGGVGNAPPIFAAATKANFKLVAAIQQRNKQGDYIVVSPGSSIHKASDLKGKRIAYTRGSSGHGFLIQVLKRAGLKRSQVQLKDLTPGDSLGAFTSGSVDAVATWEPFVSLLGARGRTLSVGKGYAASGLSFVVARTSVLSSVKKRTAIRDYLVRLQRALRWGAKHQSEWAQAFNEESGLPVPIAIKAIRKTLVDLVPLGKRLTGSEQKLANSLAGAGVVKRVSIRSITSNQVAP